MTADLRGIQGWKTWRFASAEDGVVPALVTGAEGSHSGFQAPINVYPYSAVAIRMFGTNTDNDTATLTILGSMDDQRKTGTGPMQELWQGQVSLGSFTATTSTGRPLGDGKWTAATYLEVDTYDIGVANGHNAANAVVVGGASHAILILPTIGYSVLDMRLANMDGTGTEISTLGALYREIAMGGVV